MSVYYHQIRALIDPEQSDPLRGGGRLQDVSVILTSRLDGVNDRPAGIALPACQARELAFELLELAEQADRERTHPSRPSRRLHRHRSRTSSTGCSDDCGSRTSAGPHRR